MDPWGFCLDDMLFYLLHSFDSLREVIGLESYGFCVE